MLEYNILELICETIIWSMLLACEATNFLTNYISKINICLLWKQQTTPSAIMFLFLLISKSSMHVKFKCKIECQPQWLLLFTVYVYFRLTHPNIVQLLETFEDKHKVYLVMELWVNTFRNYSILHTTMSIAFRKHNFHHSNLAESFCIINKCLKFSNC